jgi:phage gpG-like protein
MADTREKEIAEKEAVLRSEMERVLPDFANTVRDHQNNLVIVHQDSFAMDYQDDEYALLGKAIKYAGLHGKEVRVIGKNRETLSTARPAFVQ